MVGYVIQEFLPFPPIVYLIGLYLAWSLEVSPSSDLIAGAIAANFQ